MRIFAAHFGYFERLEAKRPLHQNVLPLKS
jgi:hypothetical protein